MSSHPMQGDAVRIFQRSSSFTCDRERPGILQLHTYGYSFEVEYDEYFTQYSDCTCQYGTGVVLLVPLQIRY
eukprot:scaffold315318_cov15-Prasinocladus_malaysianus.AAC.1